MPITRTDAAIELITFADKKLDLDDRESAAALVLAACFLAGSTENILSLIKLMMDSHEIMSEKC
jgi:hypothetical protein